MIRTLEDFCFYLYRDASPRSLQKNFYWLQSLRSEKKKRAQYRAFWLPKHGGGYRLLSAPSPGLKQVQKGILPLLESGEVSPHAAAYRRGKGLLDNASPHVGKPLVVKLDIRDFFRQHSLPCGLSGNRRRAVPQLRNRISYKRISGKFQTGRPQLQQCAELFLHLFFHAGRRPSAGCAHQSAALQSGISALGQTNCILLRCAWHRLYPLQRRPDIFRRFLPGHVDPCGEPPPQRKRFCPEREKDGDRPARRATACDGGPRERASAGQPGISEAHPSGALLYPPVRPVFAFAS